MIRRTAVFLFAAAAAVGATVYAQAPAAPPRIRRARRRSVQVRGPRRAGRGGGRGAAPVRSPEVGADRRVTFRLRAPNAKEAAVTLSGQRLDMTKDDQGVWSVTSDRAGTGYLHVFDVGRRHDDQRSVESPVPDVVRQLSDDVRRAGPDGVAAGIGRSARRHRAPCVSLEDRQRRPRLLRLHAARLRRAPAAAVPGAVHPPRSRRRCGTVGGRRGRRTSSSTT